MSVPRLSYNDLAHELALMVSSKYQWLENFSSGKSKRPDHEIEVKRRELSVLERAHADYQKAAARDGAAQ